MIFIGTILVPCLASAGTVCKVTEFPEHYEVVCIGDEKAVPITEPKSAKYGSDNTETSLSADSKSIAGKTVMSKPAMTNQTFIINPASNTTTTDTYRSSQQTSTASPKTMVISKSSLTTETTQRPPATAITSTETSATAVHRQGRQQYSKALQEAIAARLQLISP
jgi:hypothetical protein